MEVTEQLIAIILKPDSLVRNAINRAAIVERQYCGRAIIEFRAVVITIGSRAMERRFLIVDNNSV